MNSRFSLLQLSRVVFIVWLLFLVIVSFFAVRDPLFYDLLAQKDVSHQYQSVIPTIRYLFEPFLGITFNLLSPELIWLELFTVCYLLGRALWLTSVWPHSVPLYKRVVGAYFMNWLRFQGKSSILIILLIIGGLIIGVKIRGLAFMQVYGMRLLLWSCIFVGILGLMKGLLNIARFFLPGVPPIRIKTNRRRSSGIFQFLSWFYTETKIYLYFLITLLIVNFSLISIPLPTQIITYDPDNNDLLIDFSVHTTHSSGYLSPSQRVNWYESQGIDSAFFTDNNISSSFDNADWYIKSNNLNFKVFRGEQYTHTNPDLNLTIYGVDRNIFPGENFGNADASLSLTVKELIPYVKSQGGTIILAHYDRNVPLKMDELVQIGVQGFELSTIQLKKNVIKVKDYCLSKKLLCLGGSDELGNRELRLFVRLQLKKPFTARRIFEQIQLGKHQIVKLDIYPEKVKFSKIPFRIGESLGLLLNYFLNLNKLQLISWMVWSLVLYLFFYRSTRRIQGMDDRVLRSKIAISHQIIA